MAAMATPKTISIRPMIRNGDSGFCVLLLKKERPLQVVEELGPGARSRRPGVGREAVPSHIPRIVAVMAEHGGGRVPAAPQPELECRDWLFI